MGTSALDSFYSYEGCHPSERNSCFPSFHTHMHCLSGHLEEHTDLCDEEKKKDSLSLIISLGFNRKEIHFSEHWNQTIASLQLFQGSDVNSAKHVFISFEIYWKSRVLDKQWLTKNQNRLAQQVKWDKRTIVPQILWNLSNKSIYYKILASRKIISIKIYP